MDAIRRRSAYRPKRSSVAFSLKATLAHRMDGLSGFSPNAPSLPRGAIPVPFSLNAIVIIVDNGLSGCAAGPISLSPAADFRRVSLKALAIFRENG